MKSILSQQPAGVQVRSSDVTYTQNVIESKYQYTQTKVENNGEVTKKTHNLVFQTNRRVPKLGVMLVGWGGNNGSTLTAGILANKLKLKWNTKDGEMDANYFGSMTQCSTVKLGENNFGENVFVPLAHLLPMVHPNDLVLGGWDISSVNLADAMKRAKVIDYDLQKQLIPHMESMVPLPSIYIPDFIAENQADRADNVLQGSLLEQVSKVRNDIRSFKKRNQLDQVIVLWTANTERFASIELGVNDTAESLLRSIASNHTEISPSTLFAVASILEGCSYINGSPQNTLVPGVLELASHHGVFVAGDDFKSGQTKIKSVLVDYLVSAGIKPTAIVSYNHLGNNDGKNLSAPQQFRSKEISKSNVVDDMVASNGTLYQKGEHPDHCVVIKYVPTVGDSKRAMDEYTSEIFLHGKNTLVIHNTCEDSLLATPLIIDLVLICELCQRIRVKDADAPDADFESFHTVLSLLSYLLKAPMVPNGAPVVNALNAQRQAIVNIMRACLSLPPEDYMTLEHRLPFMMKTAA